MRIVITSNYKIGSETGTAHIAEELSKQLAKKHHIIYICVGKKYQTQKIDSKLTILKIPSVVINKLSVPLITPKVMYDVFRKLDGFKPDIIHAQNPFLISNLVQLWANLHKVPFIVTFHHIPTQALEHLLPMFSKNIVTTIAQKIYKEISLKAFLEKSDAVIALNNSVKKSIRKINKKIPIEIIGNGIDLDNLQTIKMKNKLSKKINFISLGSYSERKNQKYLIKAFSLLPKDFVLRSYGNKKTGGTYLKNLYKLISELKVKNVFLENYRTDLTNIFEWADFFITASTKEVQSLAVIEALAAARPVIGLKNETLAELIDEGNGLVLPLNISPKMFAHKLLVFTKHCDYKKMATRSRQDSRKFDIEKVVAKVENYYKIFIFPTS